MTYQKVRFGVAGWFAAAALAMVGACGDDDPDEGQGVVRVSHAAPGAPEVDIYIQGNDDPVFEDVEYGDTTRFEGLAPGIYVFEVRPADADATTAPVFTSDPIDVRAGQRITAVAAGLLDDQQADGFRLLPVVERFGEPANDTALLRAVHVAPGAPAVDIDIGDDGTFEIENLQPYSAAAEAGIAIPSDEERQVAIYTSTEPRMLVTKFTIEEGGILEGNDISEGDRVLLLVTGLLAADPREEQSFRLLAVDRDGTVGLIAQNPAVFALHAVTDAPAVDVRAGGDVIVSDLSFGELSAPIYVRPDSYELELFPAGANTAVAGGDTPDLAAGDRYLLIAAGDLQPDGDEVSFELIAVRNQFNPNIDASQLQFVHASPDAPPVDIGMIGSDLVDQPDPVSDVDFGETSPVISISQQPNIDVNLTPADSQQVVATFSFELAQAMRATGVIAGELQPEGNEQPLVLLLVDTSVFPWELSQVDPE